MKPRVHQEEAIDAVIESISTNKNINPLVVLPTGSGKTLVIAELVKHLRSKLDYKIIILSHVKEILEQNYNSIKNQTDIDVGLNSSMLGKREIKPVTVAGIQSVYRNPKHYIGFDVIIIDEAHMISSDSNTMYQKFIAGIRDACVIGLTATPYRLGQGYIYGEKADTTFDKVVCDWGTGSKFNKLINLGYLCKLTTKRTKEEMDTDGIQMVAGDFNEKQLSNRFDRDPITQAILKEVIAAGSNRKKWLIFAIDIDHAEHIAEILIRNGIPTAPVHSKMADSGFCRSGTIDSYKDNKYKCLVNVNILTTGFDDPEIDLIAVLRPTNSPVLHVQMLGRGSRVSEGKKECLVLDFAGNTERLGPINDPLVKIKGKGAEGGEPITKACPECNSILAPAVRKCPDCGHKFEFHHGLYLNSSNASIIDDGKPHWVMVDHVTYELNRNPGTPTSVKVVYTCGSKKINEWICVEHKGYAKHKADHWVKYRGGLPCKKAEDLMNQCLDLKTPFRILVAKKNKYYTISDSDFKDI